jgi:hypothetical protein
MRLKLQVGTVFLALSGLAGAQQDFRDRPSWYVGGFLGQSSVFLGSEDIRQGIGFSVAYAKPEPRFRFRSVKAQMVLEAYYNPTTSINEPTSPDTRAAGILTMARWHGRRDQYGQGFFFDLGWGFQLADRRTIDLDSRINSTPTIGVGTTFPLGNQELLLGLRLLHASNGGLVGRNQGSNQFMLTFGVRF